MNWSLDDLKRLATDCPCGQPHQAIPLEHLEVGPGALANAVAWIQARYRRVVLVMDEHTRAAAGDALAQGLTDLGVLWTACLIEPNAQGDVVADERSIVQALIAAGPDVEALVAVGSGTLHDIARFASYKMRIPFVSVPTAPSVDGFTSAGAPLIVRGIKTTYQTQAPIAVFADTDVLERAPRELVWAGFGDVVGKSTSLADWAFGAIAAGEPYCAHLAGLTREALEMAVAQADGLACARTDAIRSLMEALILSGIVMLLFGQSHPASGGEHHLSHDWEMEFLRSGRRQILHGLKVAAACGVIADVYHAHVEDAVAEAVRAGQAPWASLAGREEEVRAIVASIPSGDHVRSLMRRIGAPAEPSELGVERSLVSASLKRAHKLRNRYTMLRLLNETNVL
ncbi:sn-glycerol-1-phosphate dehydrogenase [Alicyclobacillus mali]|uniref:Sn-glycerol-1-phosphate dehydrogenase n=1 Tax=Alicyclobacillus mali (ex Roth et al. 2021) TaxID=1123961 RepID=A0ABS0F1X2_9BACL|nr:sn-glycerol-1-phosphate dehydrogenase [Alicyclobacillus mali (ex Roth et al. 2021)]MBF8377273.1 sn-glycerol-1-phosphate dehydrogenase [Alicyclobacillus mali (ex Roth et al. 2021)]